MRPDLHEPGYLMLAARPGPRPNDVKTMHFHPRSRGKHWKYIAGAEASIEFRLFMSTGNGQLRKRKEIIINLGSSCEYILSWPFQNNIPGKINAPT